VTSTDDRRVAAINAYGLLDSPERRELTSLADLAARLAGVPMATINLITADAQHQISPVGFEPQVCARSDSLCVTAVEQEKAVLVEDASRDLRFAGNPLTTGELGQVRFYGAHPLTTPDGVTIGTLCVFDTQPHPITDEIAETLEMLANRVVDLLELELTSRRLAEANSRLARSNERLAAFAGQVSHDLKNPLTAIVMSLEMVQEEVAHDGDLTMLVGRARRGADRMGALIAELLDFARAGDHAAEDPVDLAVEMNHVLDDVAGRVASEHVTVGPLPVVRGDAGQLRAVLQNLVDNAAKFTPPSTQPDISVTACRPDGHWRIQVADRGPGIPAAARDTVFEPLTRLDKTVEGAGIGLATCRRIVEAHRGRIWVEDNPGGGAVLWFELPADQG
jgi:K+-sensing histidine kinase KdpD